MIRPPVSIPALAVALGLASLLVACEPDIPSSEGEAPVDRETFIETYVELRLEALKWDGGSLPEDERDRILRELGVTADDLRAFVQVHGRNVPFMADVWTEVEERMARRAGSQAPPSPEEGEGLPEPSSPGELPPGEEPG